MIKLPQSTRNPHFIGSWMLEPDSLFNAIITFFEENTSLQRDGATGASVNHKAKKSTDITVNPEDTALNSHKELKQYIELLYECYSEYLAEWPFLKGLSDRLDIGPFNIQRYLPSDHFQMVHAERMSLATSHRVLAWMTYLNDVEEGGATLFTHYDLEIIPKRGKTLIWPADWTHAHCGKVINKGSKYIITGWLHLPPIEN